MTDLSAGRPRPSRAAEELRRLAETNPKLAPVADPVSTPIIDAHTHLDTTVDYTGLSLDTLLELAHDAGVAKVVQIGCDVESSRWGVEVAHAYPEVICAVAIHPNDAARLVAEQSKKALDQALDEIEFLAQAGAKVRAVGETGLDYYRTRDKEGHSVQDYAFSRHIQIAKDHGLTLAIHDREAHDDILAVLDREGAPERVIMHCFSGDARFARECLERGYWLSFPGTVTFKNADYLRQALAVCPTDKILIETDAPFLTPEPCRGRWNGSYLIGHTLGFIAAQLGRGVDEVASWTYANTELAYGGAW